MKETELKPCPFCGGQAELKDYTGNVYGFNGYEIKCKCGCGLKSHLCSEVICQGNKYSTPVTENGKAKALKDLINLWNGSADRKQSEGEWTRSDEFEERYGYLFKCSCCGVLSMIGKHCPECGAKMKGD